MTEPPKSTEFDYFFEDVGRGVIRGANDARGEHFTGMALSNSIVRELIQNSLDAKPETSDQVTVEFELKTIPAWDIPGIDTLRTISATSSMQNLGFQGEESLAEAHDSLSKGQITVLRVGDYGTTGLLGSEINDNKSALTSLIRGEGLSSNDAGRGGSFGIGSSVGFVASDARTVAFTTLRENDDQGVLFASACRFAAFEDARKVLRDGTGIYTRTSNKNSLEFERNFKGFSSFPQRTQPGTDVYIYGYSNAVNDLDLGEIRNCVLDNFLVAIYNGRLVVKGTSPRKNWVLNRDTLPLFASSKLEHQIYYKAISEGRIFSESLPLLGEVSLHVIVDSDQSKPLPVIQMRSPLMKIGTYSPSLHFNFGAIFICDNPDGNKLLRNIEPPAHDKWNSKGPRSHGRAVWQIQDFIRRSLKTMFADHIGDSTTIQGLEQFLPMSNSRDLKESVKSKIIGTIPRGSSPISESTPVYLGSENSMRPSLNNSRPFGVTVERTGIATSEGEEKGRRGEHSDKSGQTGSRSNDKTIETQATEGDGRSKLNAGSLTITAYKPAQEEHTVLILRSNEPLVGDLPLIGIGSQDTHYSLDIRSAAVIENGFPKDVSVNGSTLENISIQPDTPTRVHLTFGQRNRYRLGVGDA